MLEDMSHEQFEDWMNLYQQEPWAEVRTDMQMARLCWAVQQPHAKKQINENRYRFDWTRRRRKERPTPEEYKRKAMRFYAANGGRIPKVNHG